jgi:hypothetical protein
MHEKTNILLAVKPQGTGPPEDLDMHCGILKGILGKLLVRVSHLRLR